MSTLSNRHIEIDFSRDPYNIRPLLDAVKAVSDETDIFAFGEDHKIPSHKIFQAGLVDTFHETQSINPSKKFGIGLESSADLREQAAGHLQKLQQDDRLKRLFPMSAEELLTGDDPDGLKKLAMDIIINANSEFQQERKFLENTIYGRKVSIGFNDAAQKRKNGRMIIDQDFPHTRNIVEKHRPHLLDKVIFRTYSDSQDGIAISNISMAENGDAHIKARGIKTYMASVGAFHLFGYEPAGFLYQDSLVSRFTERGYRVVPIIPAVKEGELHIPENAPRSIILRGYDAIDVAGHQEGYTFEETLQRVNIASGLNL